MVTTKNISTGTEDEITTDTWSDGMITTAGEILRTGVPLKARILLRLTQLMRT